MIIITGVTGSGKSVQGRLLTNNFGYDWVSTGELLRKFATEENKAKMLRGELLDDEEMIKIIDKVLKRRDLSKEFVLDGFPRTVTQLDWLLKQVNNSRVSIKAVINLKVSERTVLERLLHRGRADDLEDAIKHRFVEYRKVTIPILDHLKKADIKVYDINAEQDPKHIHTDIVEAIRKS